MRPVILSNGKLCVLFDGKAVLRELFFPIVGLANHVRHGEGTEVMVYRGSWAPLMPGGDEMKPAYGRGMVVTWKPATRRPHDAFDYFQDIVDAYEPVWMRSLITSGSGDVALFFRHRYSIAESTVGEGAAWCPEKKRLYHYKGHTWFAHSIFLEHPSSSGPGVVLGLPVEGAVAKVRDGGVCLHPSGAVQGRPVDHGLVESAIGVRLSPREPVRINYVVAAGFNRKDVDRVLDGVQDRGFSGMLQRQAAFWESRLPAQGAVGAGQNLEYLCDTSLLISYAHWSRNGAIVAACDDDIMTDYRDHYRYVWPRDAALVALALLRCGITDVAASYLRFAAGCLSDDGFFLQRYRPDGTLGSGWHPWSSETSRLPVQTDETSLTLVLAAAYMDATGDLDTLYDLYESLVRRAARFLSRHRSSDGKSVMPSYDLWEERHGVFAFTQAAQCAGLYAAARIARALGFKDAAEFAGASRELLRGLEERFVMAGHGIVRGTGDPGDDASLLLIPVVLSECGIDLESGVGNELRNALVLTRNRLGRSLFSGGGIARYCGDWYWRRHDVVYPGNPWVITTAWYLHSGLLLGVLQIRDVLSGGLQGEQQSAASRQEGPGVPVTLEWFSKVPASSGAFPEQVDPRDLSPLSVMPLAWSHASFLHLLHTLCPGLTRSGFGRRGVSPENPGNTEA